MGKAEFTYDSYLKMLSELKKSGYSLVRFQDADKSSDVPRAILRHDVDVSPIKALEMARIEHDSGVRSTYFVMVSSSFYNALAKENEEAILEIEHLGHEIGLHFDVSKYNGVSHRLLIEAISRELNILSTVIRKKVKSLSWHIPDKDLLGQHIAFLDRNGVKNAYDPEFFYGYRYFSDSMMRWRDYPERLDPEKEPLLQILTHPVWYQECENGTDVELLQKILEVKDAANAQYMNEIRPGFKDV